MWPDQITPVDDTDTAQVQQPAPVPLITQAASELIVAAVVARQQAVQAETMLVQIVAATLGLLPGDRIDIKDGRAVVVRQ